MIDEELVKIESDNFVKILKYVAKRMDHIVCNILDNERRYSSDLTKGVEGFLSRVTFYLKLYSTVLEESFNKTGKINNDDADITYELVSSIAVFLDIFEDHLDEQTLEEFDFYLAVIMQSWLWASVTNTLSK